MSEEKNNPDVAEVVLEESDSSSSDSVSISSEVISILAGIAAGEVEGLAGMSGSIVGGIAEKLGRKDFSRGIKVHLEDTRVTLDLYIVVEYGYKIKEVTDELKKSVRHAIENTTGLQVVSVNIHVQGINLPGREEKPEKEEAEE